MKDDSQLDDANLKPLQAIKEEITLEEINLRKLFNFLKENFSDKRVNIINISFAVYDDSRKENNLVDIISLGHRSDNDIKNKRLLLDMNRTQSFKKVENALNNYSGDK